MSVIILYHNFTLRLNDVCLAATPPYIAYFTPSEEVSTFETLQPSLSPRAKFCDSIMIPPSQHASSTSTDTIASGLANSTAHSTSASQLLTDALNITNSD